MPRRHGRQGLRGERRRGELVGEEQGRERRSRGGRGAGNIALPEKSQPTDVVQWS